MLNRKQIEEEMSNVEAREIFHGNMTIRELNDLNRQQMDAYKDYSSGFGKIMGFDPDAL